MIATFVLYATFAWIVTALLIYDTSLSRFFGLPEYAMATVLCRRCNTPGRETLVSIVAGILWPALVLAFLAGLVWYAFAAQHRGLRQW
jgi:thiol:disulfide interchange protein